MSHITIDIDLDEIYDDLGRYEKNMLVKWLAEDGYYLDCADETTKKPMHIIDLEWSEIISKLSNRTSLSLEQEEAIKNIANGKF